MLEADGALATWALAEAPGDVERTTATRLADHRVDYLDFEGAVAGDRGSVTRYDAGACNVVDATDEHWIIDLAGRVLQGRAHLELEDAAEARWQWEFHARTGHGFTKAKGQP
jgi:hypothetical protein